jgi:hypothetical protein
LFYDVTAMKELLTPEQLVRFEQAKQKQVHDLGNAATAERNLRRYSSIIALLEGS